MIGGKEGMLDHILHRRILAKWARDADKAGVMGLPRLKLLRARARSLRSQVDRLLRTAEPRLSDAPAIRRPVGTDWAWRPPLWSAPVVQPGLIMSTRTAVDPHTTVHHDCPLSEIGVRQIRNPQGDGNAPFGVQLDVFEFKGGFLSLAIDLPPEAVQGLLLRHLIRLEMHATRERPLRIFARLNVKHGPNTEQLVREIPFHEEEPVVEFDLAYTKLKEQRAEKMWLDLIFEKPQMNQVVLRDLTLGRRPRAEL